MTLRTPTAWIRRPEVQAIQSRVPTRATNAPREWVSMIVIIVSITPVVVAILTHRIFSLRPR